MTGIPHSLIDDLASELGAIVARIERELRQRFDALSAELRAKTAEMELRAVTAERATADMVSARMATLRNGEDGQPGTSITVEDVAPLIAAEVAKAVAAIPPAKDGEPGESVSMDTVRSMVSDAVAALPPPQPGKDADPVAIEPMVGEAVARAVAAIPAPQDGKSVDREEVAAMVAAEVAKIPAPRDGKSVEPEAVRAMIAEMVAAIPAPRDGLDADPAVIRAMVAEAVAAIPIPKDGEPGSPGKLPVANAWTDGVCYEGDVVTHNGATWQAQRDTGREPPHEDWICLAAAGRKGDDGRGLVMRGTWDPAGEYKAMDFVAWNGGSFVARCDNPGDCPGEGWQLLASPGRRGKPGESPSPIPGPPGAKVASITVDGEGVLTLTNADGSVVQCDFYPLLIKVQG